MRATAGVPAKSWRADAGVPPSLVGEELHEVAAELVEPVALPIVELGHRLPPPVDPAPVHPPTEHRVLITAIPGMGAGAIRQLSEVRSLDMTRPQVLDSTLVAGSKDAVKQVGYRAHECGHLLMT